MSKLCSICHEIPQCPVTLNGHSMPGNNDMNKPKKCKYSQSNPTCLLCIRDYMTFQKKNKNTGFKCFSNCCWITLRGWETYGEIGRDAADVAEPTLWRFMDSNGDVKCRKCKKECETVYDLGLHIKNECPERMIMCSICNNLVVFKNYQEHSNNCKIYCCECNEELIITTDNNINKLSLDERGFKWIKIHKHYVKINDQFVVKTQRKPFGVKEHYCKEKTIASCNNCNNIITINNINSHLNCSVSQSDHR
jgi:hypothetical protein